jgi:hypothetical protein
MAKWSDNILNWIDGSVRVCAIFSLSLERASGILVLMAQHGDTADTRTIGYQRWAPSGSIPLIDAVNRAGPVRVGRDRHIMCSFCDRIPGGVEP